jgi:TolB-like protein/tRNA A-37 threonylcarbamoyl transferase component Bud32
VANWSPGLQLGPYRLESPIGAGGMGEVWKARDTRLGRIVAIKRLTDHLERFEEEARAISALNHPNICQLYDLGPDYLVLEYIDGQPLRGPLPIDDVLRSALPIVSALEEAHRRGILHRDLKPANILVTRSGTPKLLDFGLAKVLDKEIDATQTVEGTVLGTAAYMSPEQAEGRPVDVRSDIFSFGAVLYELLSGSRAFDGNTLAQIVTAVLHGDPRPLRTTSELETIVMRCLRKRASQRFQSMSEVRAALERIVTKPETSEPSLAVLPFANLSADKENEYFSDGLAEEIINALTRIPGLKVTARTSAFAFRGRDLDIRRIAEALDVRTVLEGSVRRAGNRIRVSAQLINAADGYHLWSERFDRELADVFAVQDEIAAAIAKALRVKLSSGAAESPRYTPNLPCYETYLKALHEMQKLTPEGLARSQEWFEQAIALDPNFALAHSMFGFHFSQLANYGFLPAHTAMPLVRREAGKALAIDPSLPDGQAMLGLVAALYDYDWQEAAQRFELAMAADPVPCHVRRHYALYYLLPMGRYAEAVEECTGALQEDPLNVMGRVRLAQCVRAAGRISDAYKELRQALELDQGLWFIHFLLGHDHLIDGRYVEGLSHAERAFTLAPWSPSAKGLLAAGLRIAGDQRRSEGLVELLKADQTSPTALGLAIYHLVCSEIDACADWTELAIADRHPAIFFFIHAHAPALRGSSRWPALAKMLNLPDSASSRSQRFPGDDGP